ncbi:MAG: methionine ABC transporter permease [Oscillospiraceae bacterium]
MIQLLMQGVLETLYMTLGGAGLAYLFGLPLGVILYATGKDGIRPCRPVSAVLGFAANILRSIPFLILLVLIQPFTRIVVGTTIGSSATLVPLVVAAAPFVARMVESSLLEVDRGVVEASQSMGAGNLQIIFKVLIPEARPSLLTGAAIAVTTILGYSAVAGFCGGGGLGAIATNYGLYRYEDDVMLVTVALLVILVQIFQMVGTKIARTSDKRIKQ